MTTKTKAMEALPKERIIAFCQKWKIHELSFFGSVVRNDFAADSDIDVLVRYSPNALRSLLRHVQAQMELAEILGRPVDLVSKAAIERSENQGRKRQILGEAQVYYSDEKAA